MKDATVNVMVGRESDDETDACKFPGVRKTFWRSATWNETTASPISSYSPPCGENGVDVAVAERNSPSAPNSQDPSRSRNSLLPLQPLSATRQSFEDCPSAGVDYSLDLTSPITPGRRRVKAGLGIKLDLASVNRSTVEPTEIQLRRDKLALFDRQCSQVANYHIYLGSDAVARDRDILHGNGITHVLNCVGYVCHEYFKGDFEYRTLWLQDSPCEDILSLLYDVFDYFEEVREQGGRIFVHCLQGVSRSTSLAIAYVMWREHKTFEEAFQDVKAARGVANPNMGFACQLSQYQKKLHAASMSPKSAVRLYKFVPHSPYDPLHLVLKACISSRSVFLDSRGAFVLQSHCAIFLWIGRNCDSRMAREAEETVGQIIRYERTDVPVKMLTEGNEGADFWKAFAACSKVDEKQQGESPTESVCKIDSDSKSNNAQFETLSKIGVGNRINSSNDSDYSLYHIARLGGIIPPGPLINRGRGVITTGIPVQEDGWSMLRRKALSKKLVYSTQRCSFEGSSPYIPSPGISVASSSPLFSPFSVASVSSTTPAGSDSSFDSPPLSASSESPNMVVNDLVAFASHSSPVISSLGASASSKASAASSGGGASVSSLAVRQGNLSPCCHFSGFNDVPPPAPRGVSRKPRLPPLVIKERCIEQFCKDRHLRAVDVSAGAGKSSSSKPLPSGQLSEPKPEKGRCSLYLWPELVRVTLFDADSLDTKGIFLLVESRGQSMDQKVYVYVWVGYQLAAREQIEDRVPADVKELAWHRVGQEFVGRMQLPMDTCIKVVQEGQEPEDFWEAFRQLGLYC